tara:strand:- start:1070 stop:2284 length:1215 start_codon:yes stop_codon:yes gene_type:complete
MLQFFKTSGHLIAFGFILTFLSGFGQTFLISLYVPDFQNYFSLSDGLFSSFYAVATLGSAFTLSWLGRYIDKIRLTRFVVLVMLGFAFSLVLLSQAYFIPMLIIGLYGIRLFGQGLMTHTSITSMARFFSLNRGKAIGFASLGHPSGEAVFPLILVFLIAALGWRSSILVSAAFVLLMIPLVLKLLMLRKQSSELKKLIPARNESADELKAAKPLQILKSKAFWILVPTNFAAACIGTAIIFFQLKLGEVNRWEVTWMAASFVAYALGGALSTLLAGWLTDRFSARRLFPFYLIPFSIGLAVLYLYEGAWVYTFLVAAIGTSNGFGGTVKNAALAEIYGTKIIGSVRSLFITAMVFSTAFGPVIFGLLLDQGISFDQLTIASLCFMILITLNSLRVLKLKKVAQ